MASKIFFLISHCFQYLIIFNLFLTFIPIIQALSFNYPTAFTLTNGKIFVIHSLGIDICEPQFDSSTRIITFDAELTENDLPKISISKFPTGEYLIFIINKIYVFDENGNKKIETTTLNSITGEYYTLKADIKVQNNDLDVYHFLFGYIEVSTLKCKLYYASIDTSSDSISTEVSKTFSDNIKYTGLSCEFSKYNSKNYFVCIYGIKDSDSTRNPFLINSIYIDSSEMKFRDRSYNIPNINYYQSVTKSKDSKSFFCGLSEGGVSYCLIYETYYFYNSNSGTSHLIYIDNDNIKKCLVKPYNLKTYYFPETGEYVFSCLTQDGGIQTTIYDKNMEELADIENPSMRLQKEFSGCSEFYYSIIYSQYYKRYYIISDIDCNPYQQFIPLIEEEIEEEEESIIIIEEEKLKDNTENEEKFFEKEKFEEQKIEEEIIKEEEFLIYEEEKELNEIQKEEEFIEEGLNDLIKEEEKFEEENYKVKEEENKIEIEESKENKLEEESKIEENEKESEEEKIKEEEKEEEKLIFNCNLEKCSQCNEESIKSNLCTRCNILRGYYPLNTEMGLSENEYIDCYNEETKPEYFYFDNEDKEYKLCYTNCKTCNFGGDGNENNCTSCKNNLILKPDIPNSSNCVAQCDYFYYYQGKQYKCTETKNCPENYQLEIKDKKKCIDKCENDNTYNIQYDGECFKENPQGTIYDSINKISKDINITKCKLNEKILRLITNENITFNEIEQKSKLYAKEFTYTDKHVTVYKNEFYSITLYKDGNCLSELDLKIDEVDFGECYTKVKEKLDINGNLIIVIISKIINGITKTIDKFIFNPDKGGRINYIEICVNETITVKKDIKEQLKNTENIKKLEELTEQGIDIFDPNNDFYTDICFHFKSSIDGKDIPVKDRIKLFFPNITLCDQGCFIKGVNLTTWKTKCECPLNNIVNSNIFGNNVFIQQSIGEWQDILTKTNIEVMKCYKDLFDKEMYKHNTGFIIIVILLIIKIFLIILYYCKYKNKIKRYVLGLTEKYVSFLKTEKKLNLIDSPEKFEPRKNINDNNNLNPEEKKGTIIKRKSLKNPTKISIRKKESTNKMNNKINSVSMKNSNDIINISDQRLENKEKENDQIMLNLQNKININIREYIKTDPDDMDYDDAIREDKRTFCQYFWFKIKKEQILLSTFCRREILKPLPMKIILLILNIALYLVINGLFFNEDYISDLLKSGADTVSSFVERILDRIVIITITGIIINYIIEFFFVEESKIKGILKREKDNIIILKYEIVQIIKNTYKKYNIFIIISVIIMLISLYYVFCFNNVYSSIKGEWLKSSIIIIIIMQILPILLCLLDGMIRFISFRCKSERLFRLSSYLL